MQAHRSDFMRLCQATPQHQRNQHQRHHHQDQQHQEQQTRHWEMQCVPPLVPYDFTSLYSCNQQGPGQSTLHVYPQYMPFPNNEALLEPIFVPPYAGSSTTEPSAVTIDTHLTPIKSKLPTRLESTPVHPQIQVQEQQPKVDQFRSLDEEYAQYRICLRAAFDQIHVGLLVDASRLLLETSKWLVTNVQELGLLRDDRSRPLEDWNDINHCWLALFQKQLDIDHRLAPAGNLPTEHSLLDLDCMKAIGHDLIQLCDELEPHGLVDYERGIWEGEILDILVQCLGSDTPVSSTQQQQQQQQADQTFRAQIPQIGWPLLDELYRFREEEEYSPWAAPATPPGAVKDIPSEGSRGSRGSLTHDDEIAKETINAQSDPRLSSIISQGDARFNIPPTGRHHLFHSQNQFMHGDLPLHTLPYHPPHFASSRAFVPDSYDELESFPSQNIPTTALPGRDQYGGYINSYGFPYYYES